MDISPPWVKLSQKVVKLWSVNVSVRWSWNANIIVCRFTNNQNTTHCKKGKMSIQKINAVSFLLLSFIELTLGVISAKTCSSILFLLYTNINNTVAITTSAKLMSVVSFHFSLYNTTPISVEKSIVPPLIIGKVTDEPSACGCVASAIK